MDTVAKALGACLNDLESINDDGQYGRTIDLILDALNQLKEAVCTD